VVADKIEKTAEVAIEVIDKVAEATEKVGDEVAEEFPGNKNIKKAASKIKKVMDVIEEDADKAEALIEKVSFITQSIASWQLLLHQIQSTLAVWLRQLLRLWATSWDWPIAILFHYNVKIELQLILFFLNSQSSKNSPLILREKKNNQQFFSVPFLTSLFIDISGHRNIVPRERKSVKLSRAATIPRVYTNNP